MSAIETLRAYRTLHNADNVDDAIAEIQRSYERLDEQAEENDRLRAENTRLNDLANAAMRNQGEITLKLDNNRLRAENGRLRKQVSKTNFEVRSEENDRLRADNAELREALVDMIYKYELAAINAGHTKTDVRYHTEDARAILAKEVK